MGNPMHAREDGGGGGADRQKIKEKWMFCEGPLNVKCIVGRKVEVRSKVAVLAGAAAAVALTILVEL